MMDARYWVGFNLIPQIGPVKVRRLLDHFGDLAAAWTAGAHELAAAGLDHRIGRVATVASTPDWLRPGMSRRGVLAPQGEPDAYAQYFYDSLNPFTHLDAFAHAPRIRFVCGEQDDHVRPDGALRFQKALKEKYPRAGENVLVTLVPGKGHMDLADPKLWWPDALRWLMRP